jgi:microcystin-dependent protein
MAAIPQNLGVPTGTVMWSAAAEPPVGWLVCDGRSVTVTDHPALYAYIGNTFGGDSVTFGLPNLVGRFIVGSGDPGREPFTYEDGVNKAHLHGMNATQTHTHGVTDPEHEHPTSSGSHFHTATSSHSHGNTSDHIHSTSYGGPNSPYKYGFFTMDYALSPGDCRFQTYAPNDNSVYQHCPRWRGTDFMETVYQQTEDPNFTNSTGKTGITLVAPNVTGISIQTAVTGVTLALQTTGISLEPSPSNLVTDPFGVVGGPRPSNIAFLPIIRT